MKFHFAYHFFPIIILVVLFSLNSFAQEMVIFDEDDAVGSNFYDASYAFTSGSSTLTRGGSNDKLPINTVHHYSGSHSGLLEWKSVIGGNWKMFVANGGWALKNISAYESLMVYLNARTAISAANLPYIALESGNNVSTPQRALGTYLPTGLDGDTTTWERVVIPLTAFTPYGSFDPTQFKDVNFGQNAADNVLHTVWIDYLVVSKTPDTSRLAPPQNVVTRRGDQSAVLHWDANAESNLLGYNVYRATSLSGPYSQVNSSLLDLLSFADMNVSNGTMYYYFVTAENEVSVESFGSDTVVITPQAFANDNEFLDYLQHLSVDFFWYEAEPTTGLIRDRSQTWAASSIASVGFGLSSICIAADKGWLTREEVADRTLVTLQTLWTKPQGTGTTGTNGYKGFYYHFLDMKSGLRTWNSELSSIDTGLLLAGILDAKQYFDGSDAMEIQIRALADSIFNRVDWNWMCNGLTTLTMGWFPESGFINARWIGYNEAMILYIMGLGSTTHQLAANGWSGWVSGYSWQTHYGYSFVNFPPLFGHQYSHSWIDFRNIQDSYMRTKGITYAENTRRATYAQRAYCIANPGGYTGYNSNVWGITACDGPTGYAARGTPPAQNDDGTIAPTAAGGSIPFAPEICIPALRHLYDTYRSTIWTGYGFRDAFNLEQNWWGTDMIGIDEGPIALMIENYRTQTIWNRMMQNSIVQTGLVRAGFTQPLGVSVSNGWNILSVPNTMSDYRKSALFSSATSAAFTYQDGYVQKDTLKNGVGYWIKFNGNQYVDFSGLLRSTDTVDVIEGWNLIGSISYPVAVENVTSTPGGITTGNFFAYENGYSITDSIKAGKGYWVKASDAGKLILTSVTMSSSNSIKIIPTSEFPPPPPKGVLESWSNGVFPTEFALEQNYPNPFNPSTVIRYQLPVGRFAESPGGPDESSYNVSLKVYSILGEEVATLVNEKQDAGFKLVEFNSSGLSSGIYYYQLRSASIVLTRKLAVVK